MAGLLAGQMVLLGVVEERFTAGGRLLLIVFVIILLWLLLLSCSLAHVVIGVALAARCLVLGLLLDGQAARARLARDGGFVDQDHFCQLRSDLKSLELLV